MVDKKAVARSRLKDGGGLKAQPKAELKKRSSRVVKEGVVVQVLGADADVDGEASKGSCGVASHC